MAASCRGHPVSLSASGLGATNSAARSHDSPADHQPHEQILARSAFRHVDRRVYEFERPWAVDQVIGYLYSTSLPLRRLLGDRLPVFEQEITDTLNMFRQRWHVRRADSVDEASQWIRAWQSGWADESQLNWALVDRASDLLLGRMSRKRSICTTALVVSHTGLSPRLVVGLCSAAVIALCQWAFNEAGFHRVELDHSIANAASCRVAAKAGVSARRH